MSKLKIALEDAGITVRKYDTSKVRPVYTNRASFTVGKFVDDLVAALGSKILKHPEIANCIQNTSEMERLLEEYALTEIPSEPSDQDRPVEPHPSVSHLTLNVDMATTEPGAKRFFCTTSEEFLDSSVSGQHYMAVSGIDVSDAARIARAVVPRYMPRRPPGIHEETNSKTQAKISYLNTYVPPDWALWKMRNPKLWAKLPPKPPKSILKIIQHVIPNKYEREYFYGWLYTSLTSRALVYLVLCGPPGVGKNRIKLLIRALHGEHNSADGKKETFGANQSKFNSQMAENTMLWFDELKYGPDMEPRMKEYQNSYISIERKGVDATRSTEIFCSMVISNNYPRDNYLLFNSRKFAPVVLGTKPLTAAMSSSEIGAISDRLDDTHPNFDVKLVAQIAKWVLSIGKKYAERFPNLEYQGPMYWELAHSSMSRWQKISVLALTVTNSRGPFAGWDEKKKAFQWSKVEEALRRKKEFESKDYRDPSTVKAFFETYCDKEGKKVFEVETMRNSTIHDFWVRPIHGLQEGGKRSLSPEAKEVEELVSSGDKPVRLPGMSSFKWNRIKDEWDMKQFKLQKRGKLNDQEIDLL